MPYATAWTRLDLYNKHSDNFLSKEAAPTNTGRATKMLQLQAVLTQVKTLEAEPFPPEINKKKWVK